MKKYHYQRGAILVESALVVGAVFLMLFGTVYLAMVGFDQMSADGAAFEVAHQTSVGASAPPAAAHTDFPGIPQTQITTNPLAAPSPGIPVDYGYNGSTAAEIAGSGTDRHGGVSMMQAEQLQGQASKTSASILGNSITVVGQMIEPVWLENGLHFNADNSDNYGGTGNDAGFQGTYTQGENAPPYFVGFNLIAHCQDNLPFDTLNAYSACSNGRFTPLGMAEFMDERNWCSSSASGPPCDIGTGGGGNGIEGSAQKDATFALVSCHQRVYAAIAKFFAANTSFETLYTGRIDSTTHLGYTPYWWYAGLVGPTVNSNSFAKFAGFDSTESSMQGNNPDGTVDAAVREVYGWDGNDMLGTPDPSNPNPLNPGNGC